MKYMLQIRWGGAEVAISKLSADERQQVFAEFEAIQNAPGILDANQLQPVGTASTVTVENEQTNVAEGPAVEADLALDGYYLYDAADRDAAIALASRIPASAPRTTTASAPSASAIRAASGPSTSTITEMPSPSEIAWLNRLAPRSKSKRMVSPPVL